MTPRPNRFHGTCADCGGPIPPGEGLLVGKLDESEDPNWIFRCRECLAGVLPPSSTKPPPTRVVTLDSLRAEAERLEAQAAEARRRYDAERLAAELRAVRAREDARIREEARKARAEAEARARVPEPIRRMGLPWPTDQDAVKARFRALSLKYHPDHHGGDGRVFIQLRQCYEQALRLVGGAR